VRVHFDVRQSNFIKGVDEATTKAVFDQLVPDSYSYLIERAQFTTFHHLTTPRATSCPPSTSPCPRTTNGASIQRMTSRLGEHRFLEMSGSHELMFTNPHELADKIVEACID
jgi:hypothetical protein